VLLSNLMGPWEIEEEAVDPAERRLSSRLFKYWNELRGDRSFPSREQIRFDAVPELAEFGFTMSLEGVGSGPTIHHLGSALSEHIDSDLDIRSVEASDNRVLGLALTMAIRRYADVVERRGPIAFESERLDNPGVEFAYRVIMLPFSENNHQIDFILGAIGYKEKLSQTTMPLRPESELVAKLRECRELASSWQSEEQKSRAILYEALERAYSFHFEAQADTKEYEALCETSGVSLQSRAPFTPTIKLIFGTRYDKTRVSEYAACLSYAKRCGQAQGTLRELIQATEGGIKGCVQAERAARRNERQKGPDKLSRAKDALRNLSPLAEFADDSGSTEEFVLLLAGRDQADGRKLRILRVLDEKPSLVEPIIKRAVRKPKSRPATVIQAPSARRVISPSE